MLSATKENHSQQNTSLSLPTSSEAIVEPFESSSTSHSLQSTSLLPEHPLSNDNAQDVDNISTKRKINKQNSTSKSSSSSERNDSPQEIAEGNCLSKGEKPDGKIDTPKKRFFDLKRTAESASNKISSISPSRFALSLTPKLRRKSATNHKLSQLEQQSNLFIRDASEHKTNKPEELTSVSMDNGTNVNAKHQQNSPDGKSAKTKKSSLIPSFNFKIPSASASNKNDEKSKSNFLKTETNLRNLCRNFSPELKTQLKPKWPARSSDAFGNYEEIDTVNEDEDDENKVDGERQNMITNAPDVRNDKEKSNCTITESSSTAVIHRRMDNFENFPADKKQDDDEQEEFNSIESWVDGGEALDAVSKPVGYSSSRFQNIPVRPRKGQVPHMDNYCLFDPSVDFCNEKELRKKNFATQPNAGFNFPSQNFCNFHVTEDRSEDIVCEQQLVYDISEHDERQHILAHHNYYEIDPELLEQDEAAAAAALDLNRIVESSSNKSVGASIITQTSRKSSSSSSSCDYPSLFNSVIETTPSSTVTIESTDENEMNACGKLNNDAALNLNILASNAINQTNVALEEDDENVITISSIVTATGTKKKSPQFDRIVKQTARNLPPSADNANQQQTTSTMKGKSTKMLFHNKTLSFDPLKSSHSLPQLQSITVRQQQIADGDYNIEINNRTTIQLRRRVRKLRPMSSESLDSGFTTPSPPNETPLTRSQNILTSDNRNQVDNLNSGAKEPVKNESTVLTQCDNIQQLIEVSNDADKTKNVSIISITKPNEIKIINHCRK